MLPHSIGVELHKISLDRNSRISSRVGNIRTFPLRWHLVLLVAGALLPIVLFAVVVVHRLSRQEQAASERRVLITARNLAGAVEQEVAGTTRTLQALATSESLSQGDLKSFYNQARRVAQTQPTWLTVILLTPGGEQLVNTRHPFGISLPPAQELDSVRRVIQTQQPTIGDLARGKTGETLAFPVRVPVMQNNRLRYILTAVITPKSLAGVVEERDPVDGEWTRTIVDGQGVVVARTRNPERFVGKPGTPSFLKRIAATSEGVYRDTTLEGVKVYVAFSRLDNLRWTAAVTVPVGIIEGPARQAMGFVIGSGLVLLLISNVGAVILSRRISRSIDSVSSAATALANGETPYIPQSSIQEVDLLRTALTHSADLLLQRQQERDEHLARAEAARAEAEAASRLKDEFLITVSHELRTPLNAILGWAILLRSGKLDGDKAQGAIATIERNAKAQARMVDDLLDTSRIITGKLRLEQRPIDLAPVVNNAIDAVRHTIEAKGIHLTSQLDKIDWVLGDHNRLQQVIWNLLSNAIKFTPQGGHIQVNLCSVDSQGEIRVQDTGVGIKPEFLPHVFDRFRQSDGSTTREFGGLGLGLAIVRHLVELQGGTVWADSPGEGLGATFTVRLPLIRSRNGHREVSNSGSHITAESLPLLGIHVLLAEDRTDTRDLIAFILEQAGATVTVAVSAIAALHLFSQVKPDIIISDIGMPEMDGYMMIRQIRAMTLEGQEPVPAIALTAYAGEINQQQALQAGFQIHLTKPIVPDELVRTIVKALAREER